MREPFNRQSDPRRRDGRPLTARETFSRLGLALVLLVAGVLAGEEVIAWLLLRYVPNVSAAWWPSWVLSFVPVYGVGLPLACLALRKVPVAPHNAFCDNGFLRYEKPRFTAGNWITLLFMGVGCMYLGSIVGDFIMSWLSVLTDYAYGNTLDSMVDTSPMWMTLLGTCVLAPLGEEMIFRKLFIDRARRHGDAAAILLSGLLFGLFHGNLYQFFYAAALGILLAYIYTRTGNYWCCAAMHAVLNLLGSVVIPALYGLLPDDTEAMWTMWQLGLSLAVSVWAYGTMIAAVVLFIKRRKWQVLSPAPDLRPTRSVMRDAAGNPGMAAALILLGATVLLNLAVPVLSAYMEQVIQQATV